MNLPEKYSFIIALVGSAYMIASGNPLGIPLAVLSVVLAAVFYYAPAVHKLYAGKRTKNELVGKLALGALAVFLVLYILVKNPFFSVLVFLSLAVLIIEEIIPKAWTVKEIKSNAIELAWALAAALAAWITLTLVLSTPSPIDVVTSCSMRPALERGDLVILRGGLANAPIVDYSGQQVTAEKQPCYIEKSGTTQGSLCTEAVVVGNQTIPFSRNNDIIVYEPSPRITDLIIHRAFAVLKGEKIVYVTRGDNNRQTDQEAGIEPVPQEKVHGRVLLRVPYLGFLKLFLFAQFNEPEGCDYLIKPVIQ